MCWQLAQAMVLFFTATYFCTGHLDASNIEGLHPHVLLRSALVAGRTSLAGAASRNDTVPAFLKPAVPAPPVVSVGCAPSAGPFACAATCRKETAPAPLYLAVPIPPTLCDRNSPTTGAREAAGAARKDAAPAPLNVVCPHDAAPVGTAPLSDKWAAWPAPLKLVNPAIPFSPLESA